MTRIWILLLCLSVGYGHQNGEGITLEQLEKALKASEERTKIQIENLRSELKGDIENSKLELKGDIKEQNGKIEGLKSEIAGVKFMVYVLLSGVAIVIALIVRKREKEYVSQNRAGLQAFIRETVREENGYRDEAKVQAMIEKAFKEQAQVQKV